MSDSLGPNGLKPTRLLCPWDSPGKHTGVRCPFLLQGTLPAQGLNSCLSRLLHWQVGSLPLVPPGRGSYPGGSLVCSEHGCGREGMPPGGTRVREAQREARLRPPAGSCPSRVRSGLCRGSTFYSRLRNEAGFPHKSSPERDSPSSWGWGPHAAP